MVEENGGRKWWKNTSTGSATIGSGNSRRARGSRPTISSSDGVQGKRSRGQIARKRRKVFHLRRFAPPPPAEDIYHPSHCNTSARKTFISSLRAACTNRSLRKIYFRKLSSMKSAIALASLMSRQGTSTPSFTSEATAIRPSSFLLISSRLSSERNTSIFG